MRLTVHEGALSASSSSEHRFVTFVQNLEPFMKAYNYVDSPLNGAKRLYRGVWPGLLKCVYPPVEWRFLRYCHRRALLIPLHFASRRLEKPGGGQQHGTPVKISRIPTGCCVRTARETPLRIHLHVHSPPDCEVRGLNSGPYATPLNHYPRSRDASASLCDNY